MQSQPASGDARRRPAAALAVRWLMLLCLLTAAAGIPPARLAFLPVYAFGLSGWAAPVDAVAALRGLVGHIFAHDGPAHLFSNIAALALFGPLMETRLGGRRFLTLFFGAAFIAALIEGLFGADRLAPLVGASGGISGLMGGLAILAPRACLRLSWPRSSRQFDISLLWLTVSDGLINLLLAALSRSELAPLAEHAAWGAHLGGMMAGALIGLCWRRQGETAEKLALRPSLGFSVGGSGGRLLTMAVWLAVVAAAVRLR